MRRRRELRHNQTDVERKLWRLLRSRRLASHKFRRQHPIGPFIADFCCPEEKLIVEVDGGQHAREAVRDARRTAYLAAQGFRVIRFWDNEVLKETDAVLTMILEGIESPTAPEHVSHVSAANE